MIVKPFDRLQKFLEASDIEATERKEAYRQVQKGDWREFVKDHSSKLALFYRTDITGVGTHNLSFYSNKEMFFGGSLWNVQIKDDAQNKLLCLWFNSTLNLFQVLTERKETRGGWIWLDDYVLREFAMPDLSKLSREEINGILGTFQKYGKTSLPSLLEQLEKRNNIRREIDRIFLQLLAMPDKEIDAFLDNLYSILAREIGTLKEIMTEGRTLEED